MKKNYFFVRFDDICPTMDREQFEKAQAIMEQYQIKPLLGIIPENLDPDQMKSEEDKAFWEKMRDLQAQGWTLAMHGYRHVYNQERPKTMVCGRKHSEFAGNSYERQFEIIKSGKEQLESHGIYTDLFFAPAHTYDKNTLKALAANGFKYNVDGLSRKPYKQCGMICIPCRPFDSRTKKLGLVNVIVNHSSEWSREDKAAGYEDLLRFCKKYEGRISNFSDIKEISIGNFMTEKLREKMFLYKTDLRAKLRKFYYLAQKKR